MPYNIEVIVRGSKDEHKINSPWMERNAAEADMAKIREAKQLYDSEKWAEADAALPEWLMVDPGLILSASVGGGG